MTSIATGLLQLQRIRRIPYQRLYMCSLACALVKPRTACMLAYACIYTFSCNSLCSPYGVWAQAGSNVSIMHDIIDVARQRTICQSSIFTVQGWSKPQAVRNAVEESLPPSMFNLMFVRYPPRLQAAHLPVHAADAFRTLGVRYPGFGDESGKSESRAFPMSLMTD